MSNNLDVTSQLNINRQSIRSGEENVTASKRRELKGNNVSMKWPETAGSINR